MPKYKKQRPYKRKDHVGQRQLVEIIRERVDRLSRDEAYLIASMIPRIMTRCIAESGSLKFRGLCTIKVEKDPRVVPYRLPDGRKVKKKLRLKTVFSKVFIDDLRKQ